MFSWEDLNQIKNKLIYKGIKCKKYDFTLDFSNNYKPHY